MMVLAVVCRYFQAVCCWTSLDSLGVSEFANARDVVLLETFFLFKPGVN